MNFYSFYLVFIFYIQIFHIYGTTENISLSLEVNIESGRIRGSLERTYFKGYEYFAFRGIPFAKPPLKELRFLPPQKPDKWNGVLNTTQFKSACIQIRHGTTKNDILGIEDCLYLNVYVPAAINATTGKRAVMFYIYGGAFISGDGNDRYYGPDFLIEQDVILVIGQYRLSPFGFMNLELPKYSGNMGLKDQLMALEWTHNNIQNFGGDPNKITIFGHSSGSVIVHLNTVTPAAQKFFQRAIIQSGTSHLNVVVRNNQSDRDLMISLAKKHGHNIVSDDELIDYLNNVDPYDLYIETYFGFFEDIPGRRYIKNIFLPTVEIPDAEEPFLTDFPENLIEINKHNLTLMVGYATQEYLSFIKSELSDPKILEPFDEQFEIQFPHRDFQLDYNSTEYREMASKIRHFYFELKPHINNETFHEYINLLSDTYLFGYNLFKTVTANIEHGGGSTFYYRLAIDTDLNLFKSRGFKDWNGTAHGDELCYIFKCRYLDNVYTNLDESSLEMQIVERISSLWANFAKYGNPIPDNVPIEWKPALLENQSIRNLMEISNDGVNLIEKPEFNSFLFWDHLFKDYSHLKKQNKNVTKFKP